MIFDQLAAMIEKWWPDMVPSVDAATLISLPVVAHEVLPKEIGDHRADESFGVFRLPARVTAIEDRSTCIVLMDGNDSEMGLYHPRAFLECVRIHDDVGTNFVDSLEIKLVSRELIRESPSDACVVSSGVLHPVGRQQNQWSLVGELGPMFVGTTSQLDQPHNYYDYMPEQVRHGMLMACLRNAMIGLEELLYVQARKNFKGWPGAEGQPLTTPTRVRRSDERRVIRCDQQGDIETY